MEYSFAQDWDWAFSISYNAALQASRAYMYSKSYRACSQEAHKNTFEFMKIALEKEYEDLIGFFDRMRPKRNRARGKSEEFVAMIKDKLKRYIL